jgi:adenylosuccinate synthase
MSSAARQGGLGNRITAVLGTQWGDEGKGKLVDVLASE